MKKAESNTIIASIQAAALAGGPEAVADLGVVLGVRVWRGASGRLYGVGVGLEEEWRGERCKRAPHCLASKVAPRYGVGAAGAGYYHYYLRGARKEYFWYLGNVRALVGDPTICGISAGWGECSWREHGFLAEYAWPVALAPLDGIVSPVECDLRARQAAEVYGVLYYAGQTGREALRKLALELAGEVDLSRMSWSD